MKIGVTSQNFRTITGHAGKTRRFLVYHVADANTVREEPHIDLPKEMSLHAYKGDDHPAFAFDVIITGGCGENFRARMRRHHVEVVETAEADPLRAVTAYLEGRPLPPAAPHTHPAAS
jgi:predicted Fe-Mo cluster-binding NifX family protein